MPTKTYFNLPKSKQKTILDAALKEFSSNSLKESLVSNIVKDAGIARGSFYKYFDDIEDLYIYLFSFVKAEGHKLIFRALEQTNYDLFAALEVFINSITSDNIDSSYYSYLKLMSISADYLTNKKLFDDLEDNNFDHLAFSKLINLDNLRIENDVQLISFLKTLMSITHDVLNEYYYNEWTSNKLLEEFKLRISWLKNGVIK